MDIQLALQPYRLTLKDLSEPLLFDLYGSNGMLLVKKGDRLNGSKEILLSRSFSRSRSSADMDDKQSLERLESLYRDYGQLMETWSCRFEDVLQLKRLVSDLIHLCGTHSDLCVATASLLPGKSHAIRHSFATAIVAALLGNSLGWTLRHQHTLARAALTMNLSLLSLHDDWAKKRTQLSGIERGNVFRHSELSAELLLHTPGTDLDWITAVDQHHENLDGSGYPVGLQGEDISEKARVLRVADSWCAMVLLRSGKALKTPQGAIQEISKSVGEYFDPRAFLALKKLMGSYPPGTFVRLANRETAIVTRWIRQGAMPKYATSVVSPAGEMSRQVKERVLTQYGFGIRDYTHLDMAQMARFPISQIWANSHT